MTTCLQGFFSRMAWPLLRAGSLLVLIVFQACLVAAYAAPLKLADEKIVRGVIEGQLAALAKDDADKAFSYAAPNVREALGTAARFILMVRRDYPVVYRPASVAFLKPDGTGDEVMQRVQMTDASGNSWLATYSLQRQKNKSWRISGCVVVENKGRMA